MPNPKIILTRPHIDIVNNQFEKCVDYRLSETVEGIDTGDVGYVFDETIGDFDAIELLKPLVVADINSRQSTYVFNGDDIITFEAR